jgi:hypothetical protein
MDSRLIPGYSLTALAMFPQPWYETDRYLMYEYKLKADGDLKWYKKCNEIDQNTFKVETYNELKAAIDFALKENIKLIKNIDTLAISDSEKNSLMLKVEKAVTALSRRVNEEQLMLNEAIRRNQNHLRENIDSIVVPNDDQNIKMELLKILEQTPYIKLARINKYNATLFLENNHWRQAQHTSQTAKYCYREKIARGFGFSGTDHWGQTKAKIRSILLPRANQLLQLVSVKRMLDEALANGHKVLVSGNFVFWFEEKDKVGWTVKEVKNSDSEKDSNILWVKGKILSKNHGRIVVLPYIKENGEYIQGHTKNTPHDGKALPRHKNEYLELPFEVLSDDLMIGLFGELKYE